MSNSISSSSYAPQFGAFNMGKKAAQAAVKDPIQAVRDELAQTNKTQKKTTIGFSIASVINGLGWIGTLITHNLHASDTKLHPPEKPAEGTHASGNND